MVCTGNLCRSPMAQVLLQASLEDRAQVSSAGVLAITQPADPHAVRVCAQAGLDLGQHLATRLSPELIDTVGADLVLGMSRRHVMTIIEQVPSAWDRTFTYREFADRAVMAPRAASVSVKAWVARLAWGRELSAWASAGGSEMDVADPIGRGRWRFRRSFHEIDQLTQQITKAWGFHENHEESQ